MPLLPRRWPRWTAAALCGALIGSCEKSPTEPNPPLRRVAVIVEDATGGRVQGAGAFLLGTDSTNATSRLGWSRETDATGLAEFGLSDGHWTAFARSYRGGPSSFVAASAGIVRPGPAPDSVVFRLVLRPESRARGRIALAGQTGFANTEVDGLGLPTFAVTDANGSFELGLLAPGSWTAVARHVGFQPASFTIVVPAVDDTVDVGTIVLTPRP